jgi:hypothetical protein
MLDGRWREGRGRRTLAWLTWLALLAAAGAGLVVWERTHPEGRTPDDAFLADVERRTALYFLELQDPVTGLFPDSAPADGSRNSEVSSVAASGFGLAALCVSAERGWIGRDEAGARILRLLRRAWDDLPQEHGFYYHFLRMGTGQRIWNSEVSSIDTALFLAGALVARQCYPESEIARLATRLYERADWPWMLAGGRTFAMCWTPEKGFSSAHWNGYSEHMLLYLLALGSPTHPCPPETWHAWQRRPVGDYANLTFLQCAPLFTHQFSHAWVDFRGRRDAHADYWRNSVLATRAQQRLCELLAARFPTYGRHAWGLTAADGPQGYRVLGGPPPTRDPPIDGTIVPCAPAGSLPFLPAECLDTLRHLRTTYGSRIWARYGFVDAFNPATGWTSPYVYGLDAGITVLMIENLRSGLVWSRFMANTEIRRGLQLAGFVDTAAATLGERAYLAGLAADTWHGLQGLIDSATGLPRRDSRRPPETDTADAGLYLTALAGAQALGHVGAADAAARAQRAIASLRRLPARNGFPPRRCTLPDLAAADAAPSLTDASVLAAGLLTAGRTWPVAAATCRPLVEAMDWSVFRDPAPRLGSAERLGVLFAIASGRAAPGAWERLDRSLGETDHVRCLAPGANNGGLAQQFLPGLWLDERGTLPGISAQNLALEQILHARRRQRPEWGWAACEAPDGRLLDETACDDHIVAPYAAALAVEAFPAETVACLRSLEQRGARPADLGFVESVDTATGRCSTIQTFRHQAMLFVSLANLLTGGAVRERFREDPLARRGRSRVRDYAQPGYLPERVSVYTLVDPSLAFAGYEKPDVPRRVVARRAGTPPEKLDWQRLDPEHSLESLAPPEPGDLHSARFAFAWDDAALSFLIEVQDGRLTNAAVAADMYAYDSVELFVDPRNDGLFWGQPGDFQFGFAPDGKVCEWFGDRTDHLVTRADRTGRGYRVEARIPWSVLGLAPAPRLRLGVSPAVNSRNDRTDGTAKFNWCWQPEASGVRLGTVELE